MARGASNRISRHVLAAAMLLALASCVSPRRAPPPRPPAAEPPRVETPRVETPRPEPTSALEAGVRAGPRLDTLGISPFAAGRALAAFRVSCPDVTRRQDASGLTRPADWSTACSAAAGWPQADALAFFAAHLEPVVVGEGTAFATGYYEPE